MKLNDDSAWGAFVLTSEEDLVHMSGYDEYFDKFQEQLGYTHELANDYKAVFYPINKKAARLVRERFQAHQQMQVDPHCQRDYEKAIKILQDHTPSSFFQEEVFQRNYEIFLEGGVQEVARSSEELLAHFVWVRMKNPVRDTHGEIRRESIIGSGYYSVEDLNSALEEIRKLRCVQNVWANIN